MKTLFALFAMIICFCIGAEYAVTRPASNAIFITHFSTSFLPWVWLATVPLNLLIVFLYNQFLPKIGPLKMVVLVASTVILIHLISPFILPIWPKWIFFLFAWKDIYILLMFKQLWSMIHATFSHDRAKYLYGVIFGMGTLGAICGSVVPGFFALQIGSEQLFFLTLPIYAVLIFAYFQAMKHSSLQTFSLSKEKEGGLQLIFQNRLLLGILSIVIFMQISVGLVEYQFNSYLEREISTQDLRTAYCGKVFALTNFLSGALQFIGSFFLVHFLGVRKSHIAIPFVLLTTSILAIFVPSFAMVSSFFILVKGMDVSVFGVVKEMLYIPLKLDEKYRAKAIIDVFAYRTSKALISVGLLGLQLLSLPILKIAGIASVVLFGCWALFVSYFFKLDDKLPISNE